MKPVKIKINKKKLHVKLFSVTSDKVRVKSIWHIDKVQDFHNKNDDISELTEIEKLYYIILKLELLGGISYEPKTKDKTLKVLNMIVDEKTATFKTPKYKDDTYYAKLFPKLVKTRLK